MTAPTPAGPTAELTTAWQAALAAEHQAVFGYGLVQAHLVTEDDVISNEVPDDFSGNPHAALARACDTAHAALVESVSEAMLAVGLTPRGALADYPALYPVTSAKDALALAARMEDDCCSAWRGLYAACTPEAAPNADLAAPPTGLRDATQQALTASAVRALRWRKAMKAPQLTDAFPGL
ncbi:MAG TPA: DUF4439 domain-containing protein [Jatrophihabitans sp.]|jgi:hypothetical protein